MHGVFPFAVGSVNFGRKPQIFADSPLLLEIQAFGGRRKPHRKPQWRKAPMAFPDSSSELDKFQSAIFAGNRNFSQETAGNRRLGSVTLGPSPLARP